MPEPDRRHDDDWSPLAGTEVHHLRSDAVGDEFKVFVGRCGDVRAAPPSVLFLTDANGFFGGAVDTIRSMQLARHLPPLLVIGVGYRLRTLDETVVIRIRDLSPTVDEGYARLYPDRAVMGGAPAFLDFIRHELGPWAVERFGVDLSDSTLFGHSLGGLFAADVLVREPAAFARYVIGSPSLWWDDDVVFRQEEDYAATHDDLPAKVFFGIGALETHDGRQLELVNLPAEERAKGAIRHLDMVEDMQRFVDRLGSRGYPSLQLASAVFPDEFHITVPLLTLSRALRFLYDAPG